MTHNQNRAAVILAKAIDEDRLIHIFGAQPLTSALIASVFFRGGGLANLNPILDPSLDIAHGAWRSALCGELCGLASCVLDYYENIERGDAIVLMSEDADSLIFREALGHARRKGLEVIAIAHLGEMEDCIVIDPGAANTVAAAFSVALESLLRQAASLAKAPPLWRGNGLPDPALNSELLDRYLERIRHL